jgi:hypothetical protein
LAAGAAPEGAICHLQMLAACTLKNTVWGLGQLADNVSHSNLDLCCVLTQSKILPGNRGPHTIDRVETVDRVEISR